MARVISNGEWLVVVTAQHRYWYRVVSIVKGPAPNRWTAEVVDPENVPDTLSVVASGGCTCGKPWMKKPDDNSLLLQAATKFADVEAPAP